MGVFNAVTLYLILSAGDLVREVVAQDALYPEGTENIVFLNTDNFNQHVNMIRMPLLILSYVDNVCNVDKRARYCFNIAL